MEELKKNIEKLKNTASFYENEIELRILDNCPFIVEVGALTVGTDETGKVIVQNAKQATQFTQKAVNEILLMKFINVNGDVVIPKIYSRNNWYIQKLTDVNNSIDLLEEILL
ncbi:MAG: hypothetical protein NT004_04280 [Bacteroidetes bacterium]|nr:hypothetical protein [Bacteroidota bacterium]